MTLEQYKKQIEELSEAMAGFDGSEEETLKFLESLGQKYAEVSEFNIRAVECKDLEEFKTLANSYGIEFSSDEDAKELFEHLTNGAKTLTKMVLSEAEMAGISGGGSFSDMTATTRAMFRRLPSDLLYTCVGGVLSGLVGGIMNGRVSLADIGATVSIIVSSACLGASTKLFVDMVRDPAGVGKEIQQLGAQT